MGEEVASQIGLGCGGETHAAIARDFKLAQQLLEIGPAILWMHRRWTHYAALP